MADETDPLVQAMIDAGLYPQQLRQIQQQFGMGQQLMEPQQAQGRNVGNTYVAASPLEHASNAIRQILGAKMAGGAMQREKDLTAQVGAGRQKYIQRLLSAGGQQAPGTPDMLARPADPQEMQRLAMMGSASGDQAMQHAAATALQERHLGVQEQQMANMMRHQLALEQLGGGRLDVAQQNAQNARQRTAQGAVRYNPNDSTFQNITPLVRQPQSVLPRSTGVGVAPAAPPSAPPSDGGGPLGKWQDKALKELGADFNPSSGRSGEFGKNQARLNAAQRLLTLAVDPQTGGPANLTPQQMSEVSNSLATLIGGGSSGEGTRHEMTPYTKGRSMAQLLQWWSDAPHGAGQQAFVKQMIDTAKREQGVAQQGIDQVRGQLVSKHQRILRSNPEEARKVLQGFGWDLGPDGTPVLKEQAAPQQKEVLPAGAAAHPQASEAMKWAQANPTDPRAKAILQKLGAQ